MADRVVNQGDFVSCADAVHLLLDHAEAPGSPVAVSDSRTHLHGKGRTFTDPVALADFCQPVLTGPPQEGDYILQEEGYTSHIELEDSTDDLIVEAGGWDDQALPLADNVSVTDAPSPVNRTDVDYDLELDDSVAVADGVPTKLWARGRSLADSVAVTDNLVPQSVWTSYTVTPADSVGVSDVQNAFLNTDANAYQVEEASNAPFELEEGTGLLELEEGGWTDYTVNPADSVGVSEFLMWSGTAVTPGRITRQVVELVVSPDDTPARLTRQATELVISPDDSAARLTRQVVEVVLSPDDAPARLTRQAVEVAVSPDDAKARITRQAVEVVYSYTEPPFKPRAWMWF